MKRAGVLVTALAAACAAGVPSELAPASRAPDKGASPAEIHVVPPAICETAKELYPVALPALEGTDAVSDANLRAWVHTLAGPELRGREAGTPDARRAARSIAEHFFALGADPPDAEGFCRSFSTPDFRDQNVVAHLPPRRPECRWVMLGAHYDALGVDRRGRLFPGADDNASGVALLLEIGRLLAKRERTSGSGLVLVAFGGEEKDLSGSRAYVRVPTLPLAQVALMINVDMVGRRPAGHPGIGYQPSGRERAKTDRLVKRAAGRAGVGVIPMNLGDRSDSASFAPHVPTVFFSTAVSADYHQPTDTADRVDYGQVRRALGLILELVEGVGCDG